MFFFKQKKLASIEAKVDLILQKLEEQKQDICSIEEKYQIVSKFLEEKAEALLSENKNGFETVKVEQRDSESKILASIERNEEEISNRFHAIESETHRIGESYRIVSKLLEEKADKLLKDYRDGVKSIKTAQQASESKIVASVEQNEGEIQDRLEVLESGLQECEAKMISLIGQNEIEIKKLFQDQMNRTQDTSKVLDTIKKELAETQKTKSDIMDKLDLTENEVRMLLVNSVMDQIPSEK